MKNIFIIIFLINSIIFAQSITKKYTVEEKIYGGSEFVGEYNIVVYSVKLSDGTLLYKISNKTDYDIPYSSIEVFDDGSSVLISAFYGTLTFFTNSGTKLSENKLRENIGVEYERSIKSVVDNNILLILFKEQNEKFSTIQKYNSDGELQRSLEIDVININSLAYSEAKNQIYLSHIEWDSRGSANKIVSLINEDGELMKSFNEEFEKGFFTEENLFIAFSNKSLLSINVENLEINFQKKMKNDELYIDVTATKNSIVTVTAKPPKLQNGKWHYKNPIIIKLDFSGKLIEKNEVETNSFSEYGFNRYNNDLEFRAGKDFVIIE